VWRVRGTGPEMTATVATTAYLGLEARAVEVQVQLSSGLPAFVIVGLPDKAVAESRERVRAAWPTRGYRCDRRRGAVTLYCGRRAVPGRTHRRVAWRATRRASCIVA
jgi:hypothetical protein